MGFQGGGWEAFRDARPNAVHQAIVELEHAGKLLMIVTQNIDGLHRLVGTAPERLVELHGTNSLVECQTCHWRDEPQRHFDEFKAESNSPAMLVWRISEAGHNQLRTEPEPRGTEASPRRYLVVALGSTLSVYPAASFPLIAGERGAPYVIINRGETDHDGNEHVSLRLEGEVCELFPRAVAQALK